MYLGVERERKRRCRSAQGASNANRPIATSR